MRLAKSIRLPKYAICDQLFPTSLPAISCALGVGRRAHSDLRLQKSTLCLVLSVICFLQRSSQRLLMYFTGDMYRAFTVNRIPAGRIRDAIILNIQTDAHQGLIQRQIFYPRNRLPGSPTGGPFQDLYTGYPVICRINFKYRFTKSFSVLPQADLPGKGTSSRWCMYTLDFKFFTGCNQWNLLVAA